VLVTGAAGLIGNAVRQQLEKRGDWVLAVDRVCQTEEGKKLIICDVADLHTLHGLATEHSIDAIIHCGALSGPMVARENPFAMVSVNIVGTANLLEVARIHGIPRFVNCSSTSVYGNVQSADPVKEDVALKPQSVYGASKVACEQLVATYGSQFGIDGVSLRLSWVYGPRRSTECVVRMMIENAMRDRPTKLPYGGGFHRQYVFVDDAARALVAACDRPNLPRSTYSVTGGTNLSFEQIAAAVTEVYPRAQIDLAPGPDPDDGIKPLFDVSAVREDVGFDPSISFAEGVRLYSEWLERRAGLRSA
jgi:nucleoside-diphosphate-sugar epimerase